MPKLITANVINRLEGWKAQIAVYEQHMAAMQRDIGLYIEHCEKCLAEEDDIKTALMAEKLAVKVIIDGVDEGACPDDGCSGGIVNGICSHCDDGWAYKQYQDDLEFNRLEEVTATDMHERFTVLDKDRDIRT